MPSLRPWIGKEQMKSFHRSFGQQIPDGISGFETEHAHIVDLTASPARTRFATGFFDTTCQALDTKKVFLRHPPGQRKKKLTVTATKVDMERSGAPEDFLRIETGGIRLRNQLDHGDRIASGAGGFKSRAQTRR